jgi:hypothetical protein
MCGPRYRPDAVDHPCACTPHSWHDNLKMQHQAKLSSNNELRSALLQANSALTVEPAGGVENEGRQGGRGETGAETGSVLI